MKSLATWLLSVVLFAVIGGASVWLFIQGGGSEHEEHDEHAASAAPSEPEPVVARDETGCVVVRMDRQTQDRLGLEVKSLEAALDQQTVAAYGSVMEDPSQSFTVRAPMAGTVVAEGHNGWPRLGQVLPAGRAVGGLAPQLGPIEHADLASKLAAARADEQQARASLDALRASLQSKRQLHAEGRIVSDQLLQEVEARVAGEEARLRAAQQTVRVLEAWATPTSRPSGTLPLTGGKGGRVAEILAQPGETVGAAQSLLRLTSFDRLLARVSLPAGRSIANVTSVSLVVNGHEDLPIVGETLTIAPAVDPLTGGQTLVLAFSPGGLSVQPGMPVTAHLELPGDPVQGVVVPSGAIVRYVGAAWVYVKSGEEQFTRREVGGHRLTPRGWFAPAGTLSAGDSVVVRAAQSLLSQELKFQAGGGEEEEE